MFLSPFHQILLRSGHKKTTPAVAHLVLAEMRLLTISIIAVTRYYVCRPTMRNMGFKVYHS